MTELSPEAEVCILGVHQRWLQAELAGSPLDLLTWCTEDVLWIPPTEVGIQGQAAVQIWLTAQPKAALEDIAITHLQVRGAGSVGYKVADYHARVRQPGSRVGHWARGTHLWVLREEAPGTWRVAAVTWSFQAEPEAVS